MLTYKDLMEKIDYLVKHTATASKSLSRVKEKSYLPTKEFVRNELLKLSHEEIEEKFNEAKIQENSRNSMNSKPIKNEPQTQAAQSDVTTVIKETEKSGAKEKIHTRTEKSYQHIIASLLDYIAGRTPGINKHPNFTNETSLIETLADKYHGYDGMSQSNLSRKLPEARESLVNSK